MRSSHPASRPGDQAAWLAALLCLPLAFGARPSIGQATPSLEPSVCAAFAAMRAADYPEAVRVYDQRLPPRSYAEADLAALGLLWRHRADFAAAAAENQAARLPSPLPPADSHAEEHAGWSQRLRDSSAAQRQAVADSCQPLYEEADQSCPKVIGFQPAW